MDLLLFVTLLLPLGSFVTADTKVHVCLPSAYTRLCILENVQYERNGTTTHVFPENQQHVRIGHPSRMRADLSTIPYFDVGLYILLGRPPVLEVINVNMKTLDIPRSLKHGNFADNSIRSSWVEVHTDDVESPMVYLDLSQNWLNELPKGIGSLVNLEVLNLGSNSIETIPPKTLKNLAKLRELNLYYNNVKRISTEVFPTSLTHLELYYNNVDRLAYSELHFPAMKVLNIERNRLRKLDAHELMLAMPRLSTIRFASNRIPEEQFRSAVNVLRQHNISYRDEADEVSCYYDEEEVEGVCMRPIPEPMGVTQAVVFTVMVVLVGIVFVLVTRWVFRTMNK